MGFLGVNLLSREGVSVRSFSLPKDLPFERTVAHDDRNITYISCFLLPQTFDRFLSLPRDPAVLDRFSLGGPGITVGSNRQKALDHRSLPSTTAITREPTDGR